MKVNKKKLVKEIKEELDIKEYVKELLKDKDIINMLFKEFEARLSNKNINKEEIKVNKGYNEIIDEKIEEPINEIIKDKNLSNVDKKVLKDDNVNKIKEDINKIKNQNENHDNEYINKSVNININNNKNKFEDLEMIKKEKNSNNINQNSMMNLHPKDNNEINLSFVKTVHLGIKCNRCGMLPIKGDRYKCHICKDYNLCQDCEQLNSETCEHPHDFIKMRNPEKQIKDYKYEIIDKDQDKTFYIENIDINNCMKYELIVKNNGQFDFPENKRTKFIINTNLKKEIFQEIFIDELKVGCTKKIKIIIPKNNIKLGEMKFKIVLNIDGNNYGNPINLTLMFKSKKVEEFRKIFNLEENEYDEDKLLIALQRHKFIMENAFASLFDDC